MSLTKVTYSMIDGAPIYAKDYGAVGNGVTDDTAAIQAALTAAAGNTLVLEVNATYKCTSELSILGTIIGNGATLVFYSSAIEHLLYQDAEGSLYDFTIDGTNVDSCQYGLFVNTEFDQKQVCNYRINIKNISNNNNTQGANGATFFRSSSSSRTAGDFDISINVDNVTATANGTEGDNAGAAAGISLGVNASGTDMTFYVHDCYVKNIAPNEDAIAFYANTGDHTIATAKGLFVFERCRAFESTKYSYKIQAPNASLRDCYAENLSVSCAEQFTAFGYNVTFDRCVGRVIPGGYIFVTRARRTTFMNCKAFSATISPIYGIYNTAETCTLESCYAENAGTALGNDDPVIRYEGCFATVINNFVAFKTTSTDKGTVVEITGPNVDLNINGLYADGFYRGFYAAFSSGVVRLRNSVIDIGTGQSFYGLGTAGQILHASDTNFSGSTGILIDGAASFDVSVDNCTFATPTLGVAGTPAKTRITNSVFTSTSILAGNAIVNTNVVARNNRINKFLNGIDYSFSTTAEVADNVCVDTANPFITVGVTPFVDTDNFSR